MVPRPKLAGWAAVTQIGFATGAAKEPQGRATTRLLLKVTMGTNHWAAPLLSVGDLIMARRQLLNLKQLAER